LESLARKGWTYSRSGCRVRHRDHGGSRAIDDGLFANLGKYANWNKNLPLETLRKLLTDQIRVTERTNIVQSKKFREGLEDAMLRYTNKAITTAEMISRLLDLAKHLRNAQRHGEELGLSREETAFYDALAENGSAKEIMKNDTLRLMARELTEMVKKMPKLDWTQRESVRAGLR
jgi:type I restriction enzyme R subunit